MKKIVVLNRISLDGFYTGPQGEIDWFIHDPEVDRAAHEMMHPDTLIMGRLTYQMFAGYWPQVGADPNAPDGARRTARELDQMNKVVFSRSLQSVSWVNSQLISGDILAETRNLKQGQGADLTIFGSGSIVQQLANAGLIEEYLLIVTPVVLGSGKNLFQDVKRLDLKLIETCEFKSGNVLLHYTI